MLSSTLIQAHKHRTLIGICHIVDRWFSLTVCQIFALLLSPYLNLLLKEAVGNKVGDFDRFPCQWTSPVLWLPEPFDDCRLFVGVPCSVHDGIIHDLERQRADELLGDGVFCLLVSHGGSVRAVGRSVRRLCQQEQIVRVSTSFYSLVLALNPLLTRSRSKPVSADFAMVSKTLGA